MSKAFDALWTLYKTTNSGAKKHRLADETVEERIVAYLLFGTAVTHFVSMLRNFSIQNSTAIVVSS